MGLKYRFIRIDILYIHAELSVMEIIIDAFIG